MSRPWHSNKRKRRPHSKTKNWSWRINSQSNSVRDQFQSNSRCWRKINIVDQTVKRRTWEKFGEVLWCEQVKERNGTGFYYRVKDTSWVLDKVLVFWGLDEGEGRGEFASERRDFYAAVKLWETECGNCGDSVVVGLEIIVVHW